MSARTSGKEIAIPATSATACRAASFSSVTKICTNHNDLRHTYPSIPAVARETARLPVTWS